MAGDAANITGGGGGNVTFCGSASKDVLLIPCLSVSTS
jgi:hypothetical protein